VLSVSIRVKFFFGVEDAVGDGGGFDGGADVVSAEDVGSGENGGYVCGSSGLETVFHGGYGSVEQDREGGMLGEGVGEETLSGDAGEEGEVESLELVEVGEQRIVFVEAFPEAEAGVEDDFVAGDAGVGGGFEAFG